MERESSIAAFMSLTGADAVAAESYLEMANGVVETAVNLFLETSGGLAQDQQFKYSDEFSAATAIASDQISCGGNDRELQEVHVRAPDEQKRLRLMDPLLDSARAESTHGSNQQRHAFRDFRREADHAAARRKRKCSESAAYVKGSTVKGQSSSSSIEDNDLQKNKILADLFRPPAEIMYTGDFAQARAEAKTANKWLMVNIQQESTFDTHKLNRDTWNNDTLQNILDSLCIFWQQYDNTKLGETYCQLYHVHEFPHVALIDPRTGRSCWQKTGFVSAEFLCEKISDFCSRSTCLDDDGGGAHTSLMSNASSETSSSASAKSSLRSGSQLLSSTSVSEPKTAAAESNRTISESSSSSSIGQTVGSAPSISTVESISVNIPSPAEEFAAVSLGEEPGAGDAASTRIGIRLPQAGNDSRLGGTVQRRFLKTDTVETIFRFVHETIQKRAPTDDAVKALPFDIVEMVPPKASLRQYLGGSKVRA